MVDVFKTARCCEAKGTLRSSSSQVTGKRASTTFQLCLFFPLCRLYLISSFFCLHLLQPTQQQTRYRKSPCAPSVEGNYFLFFSSYSKKTKDLLFHLVALILLQMEGLLRENEFPTTRSRGQRERERERYGYSLCNNFVIIGYCLFI